MKDIKLDASGDLEILGGDLTLIDESEQVAQNIKTRLLTIEGEWILDYTRGVPWFDKVFAPSTSIEERNALIKRAILGTKGVKAITKYEFAMDYIERTFYVSFEATTDYGEVFVEVRT